jgi:uncharacterized protein involved in exopolysaccharide biosynthesis
MRKIFDSTNFHGGSASAQYEKAVFATVSVLWGQRRLIIKTVALVLALGILIAFALPKKYTGSAYIYDNSSAGFTIQAAQRREGSPFIDASLLVETQARIFRSHQLALQVVKLLGLDRLRPELGRNRIWNWLTDGGATRTVAYQEDMAATELLNGLSVTTEPRVYMIAVRYTAHDPVLAADITNAFVVEFVRMTTLQTLSAEVATAYNSLQEQLATHGKRYPAVIAAQSRVSAAQTRLREQQQKTLAEVERSNAENIVYAKASAIPSGPNIPLVIATFLILGLAAGVVLAIRLESGKSWLRLLFSKLRRGSTRARRGEPAFSGPKA